MSFYVRFEAMGPYKYPGMYSVGQYLNKDKLFIFDSVVFITQESWLLSCIYPIRVSLF